MKKQFLCFTLTAMVLLSLLCFSCNQNRSTVGISTNDSASGVKNNNGGFQSQVAWGHHLVLITGCNDCHTPKKMTPDGPVPDTALLLSGHPAKMPPPGIDPKEIQSHGLAVTLDMTSWIGPWGISYSANLTPDETGIGSWSADQFMRCIREGKWMGAEKGRQLLPPMPWQELGSAMTDDELKAIFAYLKSVKPVHNMVPAPTPPVMTMKH